MSIPFSRAHQIGESTNCPKKEKNPSNNSPNNRKLLVDTYGGKIHVEWDPQGAVTPMGQLPFFIEFLKLGGLFDAWVENCPIEMTSPNSPTKTNLLGTLFLSILAGHRRYAHVTAIRCDGVNPGLLGMTKIVSEDSLRRGLLKMQREESIKWLQASSYKCYSPLLYVPWIMDIDTTVKVLYGHQEAAEVGYNPKKPGRPSHTYHTYFMANLRLVLDVDVQAGNQMSASFTAPNMWDVLDGLPRNQWPRFIRGDCGFGTDGVMTACEERKLPYLFKLKKTKNVSKEINNLMLSGGWGAAGQGWEGKESLIKLHGWKKFRRIVVLRKAQSKANKKPSGSTKGRQQMLSIPRIEEIHDYEYAVLITSLRDEILTIGQHYRDRADCENVYDELKNQWGWGGYTTQDLHRCSLVACAIGVIYNWWNLYARLVNPDKHMEAITSRPLLLHAVAKQTSHAGQTHLKITSMHGKAGKVRKILGQVVDFFETINVLAEQLTVEQRWYRILSRALVKFLGGRILEPPPALPNTR
jgi:Transposase DDE domain group 1